MPPKKITEPVEYEDLSYLSGFVKVPKHWNSYNKHKTAIFIVCLCISERKYGINADHKFIIEKAEEWAKYIISYSKKIAKKEIISDKIYWLSEPFLKITEYIQKKVCIILQKTNITEISEIDDIIDKTDSELYTLIKERKNKRKES